MRRALLRVLLAAGVLSFQGPVAAQDDAPSFDPAPTQDCLAIAASPSACIGLAADACMSDEVGSSTVGMGFCLGEEWQWWDARLNEVYGDLMAQARAADEENAGFGGPVPPSQAEALRAMQRAWIAYRDAACDFARAQFGGGTGGGPAAAECLMRQTALQTFHLEDQLTER
jgi:uncharacterized protein YecT (DUF1311 family)